MNKRKVSTLFLLVGATFVTFFLYQSYQPYITYSQCQLCDGNQYLKMYNYFAGRTSEYSINFPYYSRVLVPLIATVFSKEYAILGFQMVNLLCSISAVLALFYLWNKLEIPLYLCGIAFFWLLFHWTGLIRLNAFDPITVDLPTYLIQTLFIIIVLNKRYFWLIILAPIAMMQRESITVLLIILFGYELLVPKFLGEERNWKHIWVVLVSILVAIVVKYVFTHYYPSLDSGKSSVRLVLFYIKEILLDPFKLIRWLIGIFMAFGALLMLAIVNFKKTDLTSPVNILFTIFSVTYIMLGLIAGGDNTRIVFLGFPFIMTWILLILKKTPVVLGWIALSLSLYQMRVWEVIPDPGKDFEAFTSWYPEFANKELVINWAIFFLIGFGIIGFLSRIIQKKSDFRVR